jgi:uncharacterized protein (DUF4415 family)
MKRVNGSGVIGILDRILSDESPSNTNQMPITTAVPSAETQPAVSVPVGDDCHTASIPVWRGRPPRKPDAGNAGKQKLTIRIDSELANQYRNWSWECRLQLSPLIEQALREYLKRKQDYSNGLR